MRDIVERYSHELHAFEFDTKIKILKINII